MYIIIYAENINVASNIYIFSLIISLLETNSKNE